MKPHVVIPFMGNDPERVLNLQAIQRLYSRHFAIVMGAGTTIGEARNDGALKAIAQGATHLFFVDADVVIPIEHIMLATKIADTSGSAVYPYGKIVRTHKPERDLFIQTGRLPDRSDGIPEGGALVLSSEGFIRTCGFPKLSFGEDNIFHNACRAILGPIARLWEPGYHLWHPDPVSHRYDPAVMQIVMRTEQAREPEMMHFLIRKAGVHDITSFTAAGYGA